MLDRAEIARRQEICCQCPDLQARHNGAVKFCGRECHKPDGAYCEPWAAGQYSQRLLADHPECEKWAKGVVILPWLGEFGWMLMKHVRYVNWYPSAYKVVCCAPGHKCLYPSAAECVTDWENPIPEGRRWEDTDWHDRGAKDRFYSAFHERLHERYPDYAIIAPKYGCHWHMSDGDGFKFRPQVAPCLPAVDVVLSPRKRTFDTTRNWAYWSDLAAFLRNRGLTIGIVGRKDTCDSFLADAYAWNHPEGDTAGSIDLLANCHLYVGTDSGLTHLAGLIDTPTLVVKPYESESILGVARRANKRFFCVTPPADWDNPDAVFDAALRSYGVLKGAEEAKADIAVYVITWKDRGFLPGMLASLFARIDEDPALKVLVRVVANGMTDTTRAALDPFRERLASVIGHAENIGISAALESVIPRVPEARYIITAEDDIQVVEPLRKYLSILRDRPDVAIACGHSAPEHPVADTIDHDGDAWQIKWTESAQLLAFRAEQFEMFRPLGGGMQMYDWWLFRDSPANLQGTHHPAAVLPTGVIHVGASRSTWR